MELNISNKMSAEQAYRQTSSSISNIEYLITEAFILINSASKSGKIDVWVSYGNELTRETFVEYFKNEKFKVSNHTHQFKVCISWDHMSELFSGNKIVDTGIDTSEDTEE